MAASTLNGLVTNPNWHEYGPSLMETHLAGIAAGQPGPWGIGLAYALSKTARANRQEDNQQYYDRLDANDKMKQGYALQLGQQGNANEILKLLTASAAHENVPAGELVRLAQQLAGMTPQATPGLDRSDANSIALGAGKATQALGEGANKIGRAHV